MPYMPKDDSDVYYLSHDGHYVIDCAQCFHCALLAPVV